MTINQKARSVAEIVADAGGSVVGRTRLQKIGYLLTAAGLENSFSFVYKHYGPYSEDLASSAKVAQLLGLLQENESPASWGGTYSSYKTIGEQAQTHDRARVELAKAAAAADAVELELAATAVFLEAEGHEHPWTETARRKPDKAENGRLERAKALYQTLRSIETPKPLPDL